MNAITQQILFTCGVELLMMPILVFLLKRFVGNRMDAYDEKREAARKEAEQARNDSRLWRQSMESGVRALLRAEIVSEHRKAMGDGSYDLQSREYLGRIRKAYHSLGGNDIGDTLYDEIMGLPVNPPRHD